MVCSIIPPKPNNQKGFSPEPHRLYWRPLSGWTLAQVGECTYLPWAPWSFWFLKKTTVTRYFREENGNGQIDNSRKTYAASLRPMDHSPLWILQTGHKSLPCQRPPQSPSTYLRNTNGTSLAGMPDAFLSTVTPSSQLSHSLPTHSLKYTPARMHSSRWDFSHATCRCYQFRRVLLDIRKHFKNLLSAD